MEDMTMTGNEVLAKDREHLSSILDAEFEDGKEALVFSVHRRYKLDRSVEGNIDGIVTLRTMSGRGAWVQKVVSAEETPADPPVHAPPIPQPVPANGHGNGAHPAVPQHATAPQHHAQPGPPMPPQHYAPSGQSPYAPPPPTPLAAPHAQPFPASPQGYAPYPYPQPMQAPPPMQGAPYYGQPAPGYPPPGYAQPPYPSGYAQPPLVPPMPPQPLMPPMPMQKAPPPVPTITDFRLETSPTDIYTSPNEVWMKLDDEAKQLVSMVLGLAVVLPSGDLLKQHAIATIGTLVRAHMEPAFKAMLVEQISQAHANMQNYAQGQPKS